LEKVRIPGDTDQVILVRTGGWRESRGTLTAFSRSGDLWKVDMRFKVSLGKNGLGWGAGYEGEGPEKYEGDGRSPAGIWPVREGFGSSAAPPEGFRMAYRQFTERDYFIDDRDSPYYNRWITLPDTVPNRPETIAASYEVMKRDDGLYDLGLIVNYNMDPVIPGRGSAIFVHQWRRRLAPTIGCTAMSMKNLIRLMKWLRPEDKPVIIQLPAGADLRKSKKIDK
jgi:L,D-peptidoglycan transpeptidase YkuD (ErfK/YbiS/YcfS/YnhG family)